MSVINDLFENEAQRFNLIANNIDRFGEIIETITDDHIKNTAKSILSQLENLVLESPEWILNNGVPGINIGIFGAVNSGWKELVSFFIDSQEQDYYDDMGIRLKHVFKSSDESKHLLLLRRDGEIIPDAQFSNWCDCAIFIFGLENDRTYKEALLSHKEFISLQSNNEKFCPTLLVGCLDGVTDSNPRLKSYVELLEVKRSYGFNEYFEIRNADGFNIFYLFEFCTLLARKATLDQKSCETLIDSDLMTVKKRKNKCKTDDEFKIPKVPAVNSKKTAKTIMNPKRTSSTCESSNRDTAERRKSFGFFRSKNRSLSRNTQDHEGSGSVSSSSSIGDLSNQHQYFSKENLFQPHYSIVHQGILYKGRNKKWVTVTTDAQMFYHNSKQDFLNNVTPKSVDLQFSNAKVPGNSSQNGHFSRSSKHGGRNNRKNNDQGDKRLIIINTKRKSQCVTREYRALSEPERDTWMTVITDAIFYNYTRTKLVNNIGGTVVIGTGMGSGTGTGRRAVSDSVDSELAAIRKQLGNNECAECTTKHPDWLVFNFGVLVCDRCAGGHRQLGVEISKVCSLQLDSLDDIKVRIARAFGNSLVNSVLEARLHLTDDRKPSQESSSVDDWLRNKYVLRKYVPPLPLQRDDIQKQLIFAIQEWDRRYQLVCLLNSSRAQLDLPYDTQNDTRTALMIAARVGDIVAVQLLLWAGVDPSIKDAAGLNAFSFTNGQLDPRSGGDEDTMLRIKELLMRFKTPVQFLMTSDAGATGNSAAMQ